MEVVGVALVNYQLGLPNIAQNIRSKFTSVKGFCPTIKVIGLQIFVYLLKYMKIKFSYPFSQIQSHSYDNK